jgi:ATP-dependent Clp protease ATP-binding subunit ClpA
MLAEGSIGHGVLQELQLTAEKAEPELAGLIRSIDEVPDPPPHDAALDAALDLAADESNWLGHHYIGTEHLLLGITRTNVGNASDLLHRLSIAPDQVRRHVRTALSDGLQEFSLEAVRRDASLSELSRRVITAAEQMAVRMDNPTVGMGHLLLVLMQERRSPTAPLLAASHLDAGQLQQGLYNGDMRLLVSIEAILWQAVEHAQSLGMHFTGTEHLLLAITIAPEGIALLEHYGASAEHLRERVAQQLSEKR